MHVCAPCLQSRGAHMEPLRFRRAELREELRYAARFQSELGVPQVLAAVLSMLCVGEAPSWEQRHHPDRYIDRTSLLNHERNHYASF